MSAEQYYMSSSEEENSSIGTNDNEETDISPTNPSPGLRKKNQVDYIMAEPQTYPSTSESEDGDEDEDEDEGDDNDTVSTVDQPFCYQVCGCGPSEVVNPFPVIEIETSQLSSDIMHVQSSISPSSSENSSVASVQPHGLEKENYRMPSMENDNNINLTEDESPQIQEPLTVKIINKELEIVERGRDDRDEDEVKTQLKQYPSEKRVHVNDSDRSLWSILDDDSDGSNKLLSAPFSKGEDATSENLNANDKYLTEHDLGTSGNLDGGTMKSSPEESKTWDEMAGNEAPFVLVPKDKYATKKSINKKRVRKIKNGGSKNCDALESIKGALHSVGGCMTSFVCHDGDEDLELIRKMEIRAKLSPQEVYPTNGHINPDTEQDKIGARREISTQNYLDDPTVLQFPESEGLFNRSSVSLGSQQQLLLSPQNRSQIFRYEHTSAPQTHAMFKEDQILVKEENIINNVGNDSYMSSSSEEGEQDLESYPNVDHISSGARFDSIQTTCSSQSNEKELENSHMTHRGSLDKKESRYRSIDVENDLSHDETLNSADPRYAIIIQTPAVAGDPISSYISSDDDSSQEPGEASVTDHEIISNDREALIKEYQAPIHQYISQNAALHLGRTDIAYEVNKVVDEKIGVRSDYRHQNISEDTFICSDIQINRDTAIQDKTKGAIPETSNRFSFSDDDIDVHRRNASANKHDDTTVKHDGVVMNIYQAGYDDINDTSDHGFMSDDDDDDDNDDVEETNAYETHTIQRLDDTLAEISQLDPRDVLIHQAGYDDINDTSDHGFISDDDDDDDDDDDNDNVVEEANDDDDDDDGASEDDPINYNDFDPKRELHSIIFKKGDDGDDVKTSDDRDGNVTLSNHLLHDKYERIMRCDNVNELPTTEVIKTDTKIERYESKKAFDLNQTIHQIDDIVIEEISNSSSSDASVISLDDEYQNVDVPADIMRNLMAVMDSASVSIRVDKSRNKSQERSNNRTKYDDSEIRVEKDKAHRLDDDFSSSSSTHDSTITSGANFDLKVTGGFISPPSSFEDESDDDVDKDKDKQQSKFKVSESHNHLQTDHQTYKKNAPPKLIIDTTSIIPRKAPLKLIIDTTSTIPSHQQPNAPRSSAHTSENNTLGKLDTISSPYKDSTDAFSEKVEAAKRGGTAALLSAANDLLSRAQSKKEIRESPMDKMLKQEKHLPSDSSDANLSADKNTPNPSLKARSSQFEPSPNDIFILKKDQIQDDALDHNAKKSPTDDITVALDHNAKKSPTDEITVDTLSSSTTSSSSSPTARYSPKSRERIDNRMKRLAERRAKLQKLRQARGSETQVLSNKSGDLHDEHRQDTEQSRIHLDPQSEGRAISSPVPTTYRSIEKHASESPSSPRSPHEHDQTSQDLSPAWLSAGNSRLQAKAERRALMFQKFRDQLDKAKEVNHSPGPKNSDDSLVILRV